MEENVPDRQGSRRNSDSVVYTTAKVNNVPAVFPQTKEKTHLMHSRDPGNHGKTVGFFLKISKEIGKAWRVLRARSP